MPTVVSQAAPARETDNAVLLRMLRGEREAFGQVMARSNRRLYRTARSILRNDAEVEDVVQETYVRAFTNLASFEGKSSFSTWLVRIAINEALGRRRRRRPERDIEAVTEAELHQATVIPFPGAAADADPEMAAAGSQMRRLIEAAVDRLPEPFRLVFMMRMVEEMSVEETAAVLDIRPETVKTRLHRARRLLRGGLQETLAASVRGAFPFAGARCDRLRERVLARLDLDRADPSLAISSSRIVL